MTLYSHNGIWPTELPNRITLSNGTTRTDKTTFTAEELSDAGWVEVSDPPTATWPNKLDWNGTSWIIREPNESETAVRWREIRSKCKMLLESTDYKVIKSVESGIALDENITIYRQELRDLYNNVNDIDPWNFSWPNLPD
jgi:hypothetical protein